MRRSGREATKKQFEGYELTVKKKIKKKVAVLPILIRKKHGGGRKKRMRVEEAVKNLVQVVPLNEIETSNNEYVN